VIGAVVLSVFVLRLDVAMAAFFGAVILSALRAADEERAIKAMPWGVILMVSGFTVLIGVLEKTGGMDLFTGMLARLSGPAYITGTIAFVAGIVSVYSSSSGVVMPAFLPTIPGLITKLGGGDALAIAYAINVGSHLVDLSPLSTNGALCLACAPASNNRRGLFRQMMAWGWSMTVVGALVCQLLWG
jgi:di/tricarboxylate transporter